MKKCILPLLLSLLLAGCSSSEKKADTPEGLIAIGQEYEKADRYDEAIKRYQEVKNKFPYSKLATEAELAIADAHYSDEAFAEAQATYQVFKDLHPKHARVDYAVFRIALSAFQQLPATIDRDLSVAKVALASFDDLILHYPNSSFVAEAKEKKSECLKKLASKEEYIADFYFKQEVYLSALPRYEFLAQEYPNLGFDEKAYSRAAISAKKAGDIDKARRLLAELKRKYPQASEISTVQEELK